MMKKAKHEELKFRIVRYYSAQKEQRVIRTAVTLKHGKEHVRNPESSSFTCKKPYNQRLTQKVGPWYDIVTPR